MIEKSGKHFELCSKLYDHAAHNGSNYLNGHCMVSLLLSFPVYQNGKVLYLSVKRVKRGIGQSGNHMAVCKANGAETVQSQNGDNQQEQVSGGRSGSISKIILKIEKQSIKNGTFKV